MPPPEIADADGTAAASHRPYFTFFTPTRNRAHLIHRTWESLKAQTFQDFEWLVVDNCSTDETPELIAKWQAEAPFPVRYIRRETDGGLPSSYVIAFTEARAAQIITMRDADTFVPNALERLRFHWESIPVEQRDGFVGVSVNVAHEDGRLMGQPFPRDVIDSDPGEMDYRYKVKSEKWGCQRTDVLRAHAPKPTPGYNGYVPEGVMWRRIGQRYRTRYVNETLRTYHQNMTGRQSVTDRPWASAYGVLVDASDALRYDLKWFSHAPIHLAWLASKYGRLSFHLGRSAARQWALLPGTGARLLWLATLPYAWLRYRAEDRRRIALREPRSTDPDLFSPSSAEPPLPTPASQ